ncbi:hypothetical protein QAD02_014019 [Eretmocerus hayati]|uniref:Uncharacterized protein n=1 Tax=Eretmocerus hayati TaxID=131215 RepID=A0ACC2P4B4_9HYME|nr:hypothetical protein QAD02_014019 [Eretmocerus hayati]
MVHRFSPVVGSIISLVITASFLRGEFICRSIKQRQYWNLHTSKWSAVLTHSAPVQSALLLGQGRCYAKVAVMGASGGIGQPLSLLLKQSPLVTELSLYDIVNTPGIAADLSHIDTACRVKGYTGPDQLRESLAGVQTPERFFMNLAPNAPSTGGHMDIGNCPIQMR